MHICLGDNQNGNLPAKCSIKIAEPLSTEPKIALCTIQGLAYPGFKPFSSQLNSSSSHSSALYTSFPNGSPYSLSVVASFFGSSFFS